MKSLRIVIIDDHPVFRFGLKTLLSTRPEFEVVGEATDGSEALAIVEETSPDVVLMDIAMPETNGIEATKQIHAEHPEIGILIVTMVDDFSLFAALRAGARGYLLKGSEGEETINAIKVVANGDLFFSSQIGDRLLEHLIANPSPVEEVFPVLSPRDHQVLKLMAQGLTNDAIAERLSLSPKTIRNLVSGIFSKLGVKDRSEAIVLAREKNLF
ncbi:MAG: response regulator transcription factor [Anaerolineae bacterium]|nr:response regulator transcription factor [Anaerolineae bacterium]